MQHQYRQSDVVEMDDGYQQAATYAAGGAPVGRAPGHVAYPLYGLGQAQNAQQQVTLWQRLRWPTVGFVLGAAAMGAVWFYFGHWLPLKRKAQGRRKR